MWFCFRELINFSVSVIMIPFTSRWRLSVGSFKYCILNQQGSAGILTVVSILFSATTPSSRLLFFPVPGGGDNTSYVKSLVAFTTDVGYLQAWKVNELKICEQGVGSSATILRLLLG